MLRTTATRLSWENQPRVSLIQVQHLTRIIATRAQQTVILEHLADRTQVAVFAWRLGNVRT